jgi:outer membrane immunogenic protein
MRAIFAGMMTAAALVAAPAAAQDNETSGGKFVAGAIVGLDSVEAESEGVSGSEEDVLIGITAGYDYEMASGLVVGLEAEYTDSSVSLTATDVDVEGDRLSAKAGRDLYIGGRIGFRPADFVMLYAKGGYTNTSLEIEYDDGTVEVTTEDSFGGYRLGAGGEFSLSDDYAIRLEYRYSDYGSPTLFGLETDANVSRSQGVLTLLGRF